MPYCFQFLQIFFFNCMVCYVSGPQIEFFMSMFTIQAKLFLKNNAYRISHFLQTHNPSCNQTLQSFAELSSPPQSHITSSNERKLLDHHTTTNIFSRCCSLTTHHPSSCNNLNISLSKHIYLLSLNITTFTLMKFYIAK